MTKHLSLKKVGIVLFLGGIFFAILPILSMLLASLIASLGGCGLDEGSAHSCIILGIELADTLYTMGVAGWYALLTIPYGTGVALVGLILLIVSWFKK